MSNEALDIDGERNLGALESRCSWVAATGHLPPLPRGSFPASDLPVVASLGSRDRDAIREAFATPAHSDVGSSTGFGGWGLARIFHATMTGWLEGRSVRR